MNGKFAWLLTVACILLVSCAKRTQQADAQASNAGRVEPAAAAAPQPAEPATQSERAPTETNPGETHPAGTGEQSSVDHPAPVTRAIPAPVAPLPDGVLAVGSIRSLAAVEETYQLINAMMNEAPEDQAPNADHLFGSEVLNWIDKTRRVDFVVLNPKVHKFPFGGRLPIVSVEALQKTFPESLSSIAEGADVEVEDKSGRGFVRLRGMDLYFAPTRDLLRTSRELVEALDSDQPAAQVFEARISLQNVLQVFAFEAQLIEDRIRLEATPTLDKFGKMLDVEGSLTDALVNTLKGIEQARVSLAAGGDIQFEVEATPGPGGGAWLMNALEGRRLRLPNKLPSGRYFQLAWHAKPSGRMVGLTPLLNVLAETLKLTHGEQQELAELIDVAFASRTGEVAMAVHNRRLGFPFCFDVVVGLTDPVAAREKLSVVYRLLADRVREQPELHDMAWSMTSFADMEDLYDPDAELETVLAALARRGIHLSADSAKVGKGTLFWLELHLDYDHMVREMEGQAGFLSELAAWLPGGRLELAVMFSPDALHLSLGDRAVARLARLQEDGPATGNPDSDAGEDQETGSAAVEIWLDPARMLSALSFTPESWLSVSRMEALPPLGQAGVAVGSEGGRLVFSVRIPEGLGTLKRLMDR